MQVINIDFNKSQFYELEAFNKVETDSIQYEEKENQTKNHFENDETVSMDDKGSNQNIDFIDDVVTQLQDIYRYLQDQSYKKEVFQSINEQVALHLTMAYQHSEDLLLKLTEKIIPIISCKLPKSLQKQVQIYLPFFEVAKQHNLQESDMFNLVLIELQKIYFFLGNSDRKKFFKIIKKNAKIFCNEKNSNDVFCCYERDLPEEQISQNLKERFFEKHLQILKSKQDIKLKDLVNIYPYFLYVNTSLTSDFFFRQLNKKYQQNLVKSKLISPRQVLKPKKIRKEMYLTPQKKSKKPNKTFLSPSLHSKKVEFQIERKKVIICETKNEYKVFDKNVKICDKQFKRLLFLNK